MDRKYVRVMFRIRLHVDDVAILSRIKGAARSAKIFDRVPPARVRSPAKNLRFCARAYARRYKNIRFLLGVGKVVIEKDAARTRALYLLLLMQEILLMYALRALF